jgi:hypothetical protein
MASTMGDLQKKRWEESPMPLFSNAQGLAGMDVGLSTGLPYFCVRSMVMMLSCSSR